MILGAAFIRFLLIDHLQNDDFRQVAEAVTQRALMIGKLIFRNLQQCFVEIGLQVVHALVDKGTAFFVRTSISPSDRNLISFYIDGGFQFSGFSEARPNDRFGVAMTYARISDAARAADRDVQAFTGAPFPVRDFEAVFEAAYVAEIQTGWTVQPVFRLSSGTRSRRSQRPDADKHQGRRSVRPAQYVQLLTIAP